MPDYMMRVSCDDEYADSPPTEAVVRMTSERADQLLTRMDSILVAYDQPLSSRYLDYIEWYCVDWDARPNLGESFAVELQCRQIPLPIPDGIEFTEEERAHPYIDLQELKVTADSARWSGYQKHCDAHVFTDAFTREMLEHIAKG